MYRRLTMCAIVIALFLMLTSTAMAGPYVTYSATFDSGAQAFNYDLTLYNFQPKFVSGLIVVNGYANSGGTVVFGLDGGSVISAPPESNGCPCEAWGFQAPFPPFANNLAYFSPDDGGDVVPNGTLSGFSFQSLKDPGTLVAGDFDIVLVERGGVNTTDIGDAANAPEPGSMLLVGLAAVVFGFRRRLALGR